MVYVRVENNDRVIYIDKGVYKIIPVSEVEEFFKATGEAREKEIAKGVAISGFTPMEENR